MNPRNLTLVAAALIAAGAALAQSPQPLTRAEVHAQAIAANEATTGGTAAAAAGAVTFDIAVERFNTHSRVQYYLNFFRGMENERFGIWLSRMPKYEIMIRRRLQQEGLPN